MQEKATNKRCEPASARILCADVMLVSSPFLAAMADMQVSEPELDPLRQVHNGLPQPRLLPCPFCMTLLRSHHVRVFLASTTDLVFATACKAARAMSAPTRASLRLASDRRCPLKSAVARPLPR